MNNHDFAEKIEDSDDNFVIHKDIAERFTHIEYYTNLFELLNNKFKTRYSKEQIEQLKEKEAESLNYVVDEEYLKTLGHIRPPRVIFGANASDLCKKHNWNDPSHYITSSDLLEKNDILPTHRANDILGKTLSSVLCDPEDDVLRISGNERVENNHSSK